MSNYQPHPAAELFPMMPPDQYEAFKEDIRKNGFQQDVVLYKGQILDGRNRYKAAIDLGMLDDLPIAEMDDDTDIDPYQWVISRNLHRRHLNESQRAAIATKLATLGKGKPSDDNTQICVFTQKQAAEMLQVSPRSVQHARTVLDHGSQELIEAVEQGKVAVSKAAAVARDVPQEQQLQAATEIKLLEKKRPELSRAEQRLYDRDLDQEAGVDFLRCRSPLNRLKKLVAELTDHQKQILKEWLA